MLSATHHVIVTNQPCSFGDAVCGGEAPLQLVTVLAPLTLDLGLCAPRAIKRGINY